MWWTSFVVQHIKWVKTTMKEKKMCIPKHKELTTKNVPLKKIYLIKHISNMLCQPTFLFYVQNTFSLDHYQIYNVFSHFLPLALCAYIFTYKYLHNCKKSHKFVPFMIYETKKLKYHKYYQNNSIMVISTC